MDARNAVCELLRVIDLNPFEWEEARALAGEASPYIGQILDAGFGAAQAAVVIFTGDDLSRVGKRYRLQEDGPDEKELTPQARPNVLFEAGMAFGKCPERTVLVSIGRTRQFTDVIGRHIIHLSNSGNGRQAVAERLREAGCAVKTENRTDWMRAGNFDAAYHPPDDVCGLMTNDLLVTDRHVTEDPKATYPVKIWVELRNEGSEYLDVEHMGWRPTPGGVDLSYGSKKLQIRLGHDWCPSDGVSRLHLQPQGSVRTWMSPGKSHTLEDLKRRCQVEGQVGAINLRVHGKAVQVLA